MRSRADQSAFPTPDGFSTSTGGFPPTDARFLRKMHGSGTGDHYYGGKDLAYRRARSAMSFSGLSLPNRIPDHTGKAENSRKVSGTSDA